MNNNTNIVVMKGAWLGKLCHKSTKSTNTSHCHLVLTLRVVLSVTMMVVV